MTNGDDRSAREAIRGLVVTHARFSGFEAKPPPDVDVAEHGRYGHAVETMEAVYRSTRGGTRCARAASRARSSSIRSRLDPTS